MQTEQLFSKAIELLGAVDTIAENRQVDRETAVKYAVNQAVCCAAAAHILANGLEQTEELIVDLSASMLNALEYRMIRRRHPSAFTRERAAVAGVN